MRVLINLLLVLFMMSPFYCLSQEKTKFSRLISVELNYNFRIDLNEKDNSYLEYSKTKLYELKLKTNLYKRFNVSLHGSLVSSPINTSQKVLEKYDSKGMGIQFHYSVSQHIPLYATEFFLGFTWFSNTLSLVDRNANEMQMIEGSENPIGLELGVQDKWFLSKKFPLYFHYGFRYSIQLSNSFKLNKDFEHDEDIEIGLIAVLFSSVKNGLLIRDDANIGGITLNIGFGYILGAR